MKRFFYGSILSLVAMSPAFAYMHSDGARAFDRENQRDPAIAQEMGAPAKKSAAPKFDAAGAKQFDEAIAAARNGVEKAGHQATIVGAEITNGNQKSDMLIADFFKDPKRKADTLVVKLTSVLGDETITIRRKIGPDGKLQFSAEATPILEQLMRTKLNPALYSQSDEQASSVHGLISTLWRVANKAPGPVAEL